MSLWIAIAYILSTIIVALISPFWGLVGLVGSILIRFQDRFPEINAHPSFLYMSIACVIGFLIHRDKLGKAKFWPDKYWLRFLGWTALGLILLAPSTFVNEIKFLLSSMVLYYFSSRSLTTETRYLIFFAAMISISVGMGYEAVTSFLEDPENSPFVYRGIDETRLIGWGRYANANEFGALMVIPLGLLLALILLSKSMLFKGLYILVGAFLVYTTGLTYSRTCMAIIGIMAMTVAALWGRGNVIKRAIIIGAVGISLTSVLTIIPGPLQSRFMTILNYQEDASFQGRQRAWDQGFHMARHSPIFGVGMSQWPNYHGKAPHNSFVQALAETGYVGLFFYLCALFQAFKTNLRVIEIDRSDPRYDSRRRILAICLTATLVGYIVYAFLGNQAYTPFMYIYTGLCAGLANLVDLKQKVPPPVQNNGPEKKRLKSRKKRSDTQQQLPMAPEPPKVTTRFPQAPR